MSRCAPALLTALRAALPAIGLVALLAGATATLLQNAHATTRTAAPNPRAEAEAARLVELARGYIAKGQYRAAEIELRNALHLNRQLVEARSLLGIARLELGNPLDALNDLQNALAATGERARWVPLIARALNDSGQHARTLAEFGAETLPQADAQASLQVQLGAAHLALGQLEPAERAFTAATTLRAGDVKARLGLGQIHLRRGQVRSAELVADALLEHVPGSAEARLLKANALIARGERTGARRQVEQALAAAPDHVPALQGLAVLLIEAKEYPAAKARIDRLRQLAPGHAPYLEALLAARQGREPAAREALARSLAAQPDHLLSLMLAAELDLEARAHDAAERSLRKVLVLAPDGEAGAGGGAGAFARRLLINLYLATGRPERALQTLQPWLEAKEAKDAKDDVAPEALAAAAEAHLALGDAPRAMALFERAGAALAARGGDALALKVRAAQARIARGGAEAETGFAALEKLARAEPKNPRPDLVLIAALLARKDFGRALAAQAVLAPKQPDHPATHHLRGLALAGRGEAAAARASFERAVALVPAYMPALEQLARLDLAAGQAQTARRHFARVIEQHPHDAAAMLHQAAILRATGGDGAEIVALYERAIAAEPAAAQPRIALAEHYLRGHDGKKALAVAQAAAAALPHEAAVQEALGTAQFAAGQPKEAIATLQALVAARPQAVTAQARLAGIQGAGGDAEQAARTLRRALAASPGHPELTRDLALYLQRAGRPAEALAEARAVQKAKPRSALGHLIEGDVLAAQAQWPLALAAYREAERREAGAEIARRVQQAQAKVKEQGKPAAR